MQEPVVHKPAVRSRKIEEARPVRQEHQAYCGCGWYGQLRDTYQEASQDCADHMNASSPEFKPPAMTSSGPLPDHETQAAIATRAEQATDHLRTGMADHARKLVDILEGAASPDWIYVQELATEIATACDFKLGR